MIPRLRRRSWSEPQTLLNDFDLKADSHLLGFARSRPEGISEVRLPSGGSFWKGKDERRRGNVMSSPALSDSVAHRPGCETIRFIEEMKIKNPSKHRGHLV